MGPGRGKDFREKRADLLFMGLLYPVIGLIAVVVTFNNPLLPLFFLLVAGLFGFCELARRREEGRDSRWCHFFGPPNGRSHAPLAMLTGGLAVLLVEWLVVAYMIYDATFGVDAPLDIAAFLARVFKLGPRALFRKPMRSVIRLGS